MMNRNYSLVLMTGAIALGWMSLACSSRPAELASAAPSTVTARVVEAQRATVPQIVEASGTVHSAEVAQIAAQVMGNVTSVAVHGGDTVRRGQVLITIADEQLRAGVDRAQAAVNAADHDAVAADSDRELAQSTLNRYQTLFDKKAVSPQEFDEVRARLRASLARGEMARSNVAQARAALAEAKSAAQYARLLAPFDGVVTERRADPGTMATPGLPLLTVESRGRYRLEVNVDESSLRAVRLGQGVPVAIDALGGSTIDGKVAQIVPAADPASRSFVVKIDLPQNASLRSGLFGRARFQLGEHEAIVLPASAIVTRGQLQGIFVVGQDHVATLRYVTLGPPVEGKVEVLSGCGAGEFVVDSPGTGELGGKRIEVRK